MNACSKKIHHRKTISDWGQDSHNPMNSIKNMEIGKIARQEYLILKETLLIQQTLSVFLHW
jgi:hypothetical protein